MSRQVSNYSSYQFAIVRLSLGLYLVFYFAKLARFAPDLLSDAGMLPDPALNWTHGIFPNVILLLRTPGLVTLFVLLLLLLSLFLTFGISRRLVSVLLWYGWACILNRNNLLDNPSLPYIGWLLLACGLIPSGEPLRLRRKRTDVQWVMPDIIFQGAWIILALGYSASGLAKVASECWRDGSAIRYVLELPITRDYWVTNALLRMPGPILKGMTWFVVGIEVIFAPLCIWRRGRMWAWFSLSLLWFSLLFVMDIADVLVAMLIFHAFTFDRSWFVTSGAKVTVAARNPKPGVLTSQGLGP